MKTLNFIVGLMLITSVAMAQEQIHEIKPKPKIKTVMGGDSHISGFGTLDLKTTEIKDELALLPGISAGMIMNDHFVLGIAGYGIATKVGFDGQIPAQRLYLYGGYGGLLLGGIIAPKEVIHAYIPVIVGAGGAYVTEEAFDDLGQNDNTFDESTAYFVVEPGIEVEVNITKFFRFSLGGSYRWVRQSELVNLTDRDLSNYNGYVSLKFGGF